jgi:hypothetical protein
VRVCETYDPRHNISVAYMAVCNTGGILVLAPLAVSFSFGTDDDDLVNALGPLSSIILLQVCSFAVCAVTR